MRPRELTLEGFRSYRERTTFDFRGRRLIGIVGPIGAGKSSILDAIAFALYGKTPAFERDTRSLIHQLADVAQVRLVFEADGQVWRVTRGLRRRGQSGHKLERLEADDPDAPALETIEREKPTRDRVTELLGLDFEAFCRSVLLAQNRFADFLTATPGGRDGVLKGVFGYERFDAALARAKLRVAEGEAAVAALQDEGARLATARASVEDARGEVTEARRRAEAFEEARPEIEAHLAARGTAARALTQAQERADAIARAASSLPTEVELTATLDAGRSAAEAAADAEAALAAADLAVTEATTERDAAAARAGDLRTFTQLVARMRAEATAASEAAERLRRAVAVREEAARAAEDAAAAIAAARTAAEGAEGDLRIAAAALETAEVALHEARHAEMAFALREGLEAGTPCPVCSQTVDVLPRKGRAPATKAATKALDTARTKHDRAAAAAEAARTAVTTGTEREDAAGQRVGAAAEAVAAAEGELGDAEAALAATQADVVDRLGEGDPEALLDERERELRDAEERLAGAAATASAARTSLDAARRGAAEAATALGRLAAVLAGAWGLLGETREPATDVDDVREAFVELGVALVDRHEEVTAAREEAHAALAAAEEGLAGRMASLGVAPDADFTDALAAVRATRAAAEERLRQLEDLLVAGEDLDRRLVTASERLSLARRLRDDLQPSRFQAWVLAEERAALADLGSVHLEELTDGAYRFTDDDSFRIVDLHAGGTERPSGSLSGGETFLASLALALALAEMVARGGGRLDAFLLDEGFGSLDPEHLERAMDGIGRLVASDGGRLVVLVSHVELMREMLEDLIVLTKDERTGTTVVVSGAAPATG